MEQKDYKIEIVNELLKNENHLRGIAKRLNVNHMKIVRNINKLAEENVVDYIEEGKNKRYFLKKTIEAKHYIFSTESYNQKKIVKKYPHLRMIFEKIQKDKRIKLAILFGSYAKEIAKPGSDIDIYIGTSNKKIKEDITLIDSRLSIKIGKYDKSNLLVREIKKNHVIIKGVEEYYEKDKFFE